MVVDGQHVYMVSPSMETAPRDGTIIMLKFSLRREGRWYSHKSGRRSATVGRPHVAHRPN